MYLELKQADLLLGCALSAEYAGLSLWHADPAPDLAPRARRSRVTPTPTSRSWAPASPGCGPPTTWPRPTRRLRIVVLESEVAGFGASGPQRRLVLGAVPRLRSTSWPRLPGASRDAAVAQHRAMRATVDEVGRGRRGRGDRRPLRQGRHDRRWPAPRRSGPGPQPRSRRPGPGAAARTTCGCSTPTEARAVLRATGTLGATYTPDCAAVHPARLVRGLAEAVERRGVRIHEQHPGAAPSSRAGWSPSTARCAPSVVVRATEGYTASLAGHAAGGRAGLLADRRDRAAARASTWEQIGLARRETFSDHRHLIVYGQRTADDRLVFGGRGAPYHFGSRIRGRRTTATSRSSRACARRSSTCSRCCADAGSPTPGAARSASPATGCASVGPGPAHRPRLGRRLRR